LVYLAPEKEERFIRCSSKWQMLRGNFGQKEEEWEKKSEYIEVRDI
jgi:hypothetical protein